jgi:hypothetical protein
VFCRMRGESTKKGSQNEQPESCHRVCAFTLAEGVDESTLIAAADALQRDFFSQQKGFIKRDLVRVAERKWADIICWESRDSVEQAMQVAPSNPAALQYFQLMVNDGESDPSSGLMLMTVAKSYS